MSDPKSTTALTKRTLNAFVWRFTSVSATVVLQFIVTIILSRLLTPTAFGLVGQAMIIIGFARVVSEVGMVPALVQRENLTESHIQVGFTLSVLWGLLLTFVIFISAPFAAVVFHTPEIIPIIQFLSLTFMFANFGATSQAMMQRKLEFRKLFLAEFISYICGYIVVGVTLALLKYGVWSLAWAALIQSVLKACLLFFLSPHKIRPTIKVEEARHLLSFGIGMSLTRMANYAAQNADYLVVGRWLGATNLGLYTKSYQLMVLPVSQFSAVASFVLFPAYAEAQNDQERLRRAYFCAVFISSVVVFPAMVVMAIVAPEAIRGLFGPQWTGAVEALQILCIGGPFRAMYNLGDAIARAKGAVYRQFTRQLIYAVVTFSASLIGSKLGGIEGVAIGVVCALAVIYIMMGHLTLDLIDSNWKDYLKAQMHGAILAIIVACVALPSVLLFRFIHLPDLVILMGTLIISAVTMILVSFKFRSHWLQNIPESLALQIQQIGKSIFNMLPPFVARRVRNLIKASSNKAR